MHVRKTGHSCTRNGIDVCYVEILCDTVAEIPNPAEHPEYATGSELRVLEGGGKKYILSCGRTWVEVPNFTGAGSSAPLTVTDFSYFHYKDVRLDLLGKVDTSKATSFKEAFYNCKAITEIPALDTSNGTDFSSMFSSSAVTSIPELDTSNGTNFASMFKLTDITSIPELDTSNGTDFSYMFNNCSVLTSIPDLDTSNGTNFASMFTACYQLTSAPKLDTSNGTDFSSMFATCTRIKRIGKIDLNKATSVRNMVAGCAALEELDIENVRISLSIGFGNGSSGNDYGYLLSVESLVHTIQELCTVTTSQKLTIGSANTAKIANLYCKVLDETNEKMPMELCESTDEGAMTLSAYAALKNWTIA